MIEFYHYPNIEVSVFPHISAEKGLCSLDYEGAVKKSDYLRHLSSRLIRNTWR